MKNQNVCVIGGAGFLGSHLVDYLVKDNNVLVLDNLIIGRKDFVNPLAKFIWFDITHSEFSLNNIFKKYGIKYVFNYAAEPYVPASYDRPLHTFEINTKGALMVMNAAQDAGVRGILQISSAEIYGDIIGKINEEATARPHSTYGASKLAIDNLVQTRFREAGSPIISLRQFNCIGERDVLHPYVVPVIYTQLLKGREVRLGNNSFRDFMYAGDQARMAVNLLEHGEFGEVYNLGSETGIQIYELAKLIAEIMGKEIEIVVDESRKRKWEIWNLCSDNTKIHETIKTGTSITFEEALKKTISYYDQNPGTWAF
jgi:nucleoside-diphosphate-sugar epimerase